MLDPKDPSEKNSVRKTIGREVSAGIIIFRRTKDGPVFLILYNGGDYWNFPKGKIENEERSLETAVRETCEETGLDARDLRILRDFRTQEQFVFRRNRRTISKKIIFYAAETRRAQVRLAEKTRGERHQGYGWFSYKEAVRILGKYRESQRVLKETYEFICGKSPKNGRRNSHGQNHDLQRSGGESGKPQGGQGGRQDT